MRLIDADELIELMIKDRDYAGENGFIDMFYERQHLIGVINEQPTAYDVDKEPGKPEPSYRIGWNACLDEILKEREADGNT